VELLAGLVAPTSGTVRRARGPVAIVFQEAFLFSGTIRHNLELGRRHADEDLWDALALARQRVALARALLRRPDLLLLDDTTSALDPATEAAVLANLRQGLAGTTVVMVASRPSTIALADEVMYLAGGRLVAHGPHAALMAAHDGYRSLVEAFESERAEDEEAVGAGVRRD
jgi:ABC-type multidrug transport system fused ATPase/permease subunit